MLHDGQWSALNEARFYANDLRVTEINYQPHAANLVAGMGEAGVDASQFEFVELANTGSQPLDLSGVRFTRGIEFVFADNTLLGPGQRTVVVANPAAFQSRYGAAVAVAGQFAGDLANDGERIELRDKDANALVSLDYGVDDPWPRRAAGAGSSLEVIDPLGSITDAANWRPSTRLGGSPGQAGLRPRGGLRSTNYWLMRRSRGEIKSNCATRRVSRSIWAAGT